jgi:hypothetical protein
MNEAFRTQIPMRFSVNDWAILNVLQKRLGIESRSELFRLSLRSLARENGLDLDDDGMPVETSTPKPATRRAKR